MVRTLVVSPLALLLSLSLIYGLAVMTAGGKLPPETTVEVPNFDFLLVRDESDLSLIRRERPPIPEMVSEPQPPTVQAPPQPQLEISKPSVEVPNIDAPSPIKLAANLKSLELVVDPPETKPTPPKPVKKVEVKTKPVDLSLSIESNPQVTRRVQPDYPLKALRKRIEGEVEVQFLITPDGKVDRQSIKIISANPKGVFDKAVLRAIKRWRFQVRYQGGQAVAYWARQKLVFKVK